MAHNSTAEVETEIQSRESYLQLADQAAPNFILEDSEGNRHSLDGFRGKVVILNFTYARCTDVCPVHSLKIAAVQAQLAQARLADRVQFITVATDTEDREQTRELMRSYALKYGLNANNWLFLHGGSGAERAGLGYAQGYGLKFSETAEGPQMHGVVTFLIDAEGQLRARYHGLKFNNVNLTLHAGALINGQHH